MSKFRYFSRFERLEREEKESYSLAPSRPLTRHEETGRSPAVPLGGLQRAEGPSKARISRASADLRAAETLVALRDKLNTFQESDFADPSSRKAYRSLRNAQLALEASRQNVSVRPDGKARVFSGPVGGDWPLTKYGTAARYSNWTSVGGRPQLRRKSHLLPCIQRAARRSVLFALGKGGKGFRTPHHRNKNSWIPC